MISETQKLQSLIVHYERQLHCQVTRYQKAVIDKLLHRDFEIGRSGIDDRGACRKSVFWIQGICSAERPVPA